MGFYEYGNALRELDRLISSCTDEELYELDRMVAEMDEFTVFTNLSRKQKSGPTSLNDPIDAENERRGLRWVTALARTELGAITAAFTSVKRPFEKIANVRFDLKEYNTLLADGARTHYWALMNDPKLRSISRTPRVTVQVLSYGRRLAMAQEMLRSAVDSTPSENLTYASRKELKDWKNSLGEIQGLINGKIRAYQTEVTKTSGPFSWDYSTATKDYDPSKYRTTFETEFKNGKRTKLINSR